MDTIIALQGLQSQGKTSALTIFHSLLIPAKSFVPVAGEYIINSNGDIMDIFEKAGKRIGIASAGDIPSIITSNISYLQSRGCNLIFTAARSQQYIHGRRTVDAIEAFTSYIKLYKQKQVSPTPVSPAMSMTDPYNIADANELYTILDQLLK